MRKYKFRAWDRRTRMMVYDFALCSGGQVQRVYRGQEYNSALRHLDSSGCWGVLDFSDWYANCDDFVVMQFTGLLDSQGSEVYEGDILRLKPGVDVVRVVFFSQGGYWLKIPSGEFEAWGIGVIISSHQDAVVIGNVFEHPNLLNQNHERLPDPPPEQEEGDAF